MEHRPILIAQENFQAHREALTPLDLAGRFEYIHASNLWSGEQSVSGVGSALDATVAIRERLPGLLREIGAGAMLDVPCGDFRWLSAVELGVRYTGADIVEALVEENRRKFAGPGREFVRLDLTRDPLPRADVVLCRDCLVHLSFANIHAALANIRRSGARWVLMTNFLDVTENRDIEDGDWRPINFELAPFSLPAPDRVIVENCEEAGGAYRDKTLSLWRWI